jgi:hypothetical protein
MFYCTGIPLCLVFGIKYQADKYQIPKTSVKELQLLGTALVFPLYHGKEGMPHKSKYVGL